MGKTYQTTTIDAVPQAVWDRISNFHDMSWAAGVITSCEAVGETDGFTAGAQRILNGAFHETLLEADAGNYRIRYSIDQGPPPVGPDDISDYQGVLELQAGESEGQTTAVWTSIWNGDNPETAEFCHGIYVALLDALKASFATSAEAR